MLTMQSLRTNQVIEGAAMKIVTYSIKVTATQAPEFMDITEQVCQCVSKSGIVNGIAVVFSKHTTASIRINEKEPLLLEDMKEFLENMSPRDGSYRHNDFDIRTVNMTEDECPNGHAHCQHLFLGTSESIPVIGSSLQIGQCQSIFLIELDRPREREVLIQILGV